MPLINLPEEYNSLEFNSLKEQIRPTGRNYMIQNQKERRRIDHSKPDRLDCWLIGTITPNQDTKQEGKEVIAILGNIGGIANGYFCCHDSGRRCNAVKIIERKKA